MLLAKEEMRLDNGGNNYFNSKEPLVKNNIIDLPNAASRQEKKGRKTNTERKSTAKINSSSLWLPVKAEGSRANTAEQRPPVSNICSHLSV